VNRSRVLIALTLSLVVAATTACGVPPSDGAQPVESDIAALLDRGAGSTAASPGEVDVVVAWVRSDQLIRATRQVSAETRQEQLDAALAALLGGPSADEQQGGLTTLLPPDLRVDGVVDGARVDLDLTAASALEPGGVPLAVGQVALTALGVPGVRRVVFAVGGDPTPVPLPDGGTTRVVRAADYRTVTG
jgi:spore germination protein GerM